MLTDRGKLLLVAVPGLWLAGRALGVPEVSLAAAATLGLVLLAAVYTRLASHRLTAGRRVRPTRLLHGEEGRVDLEVRNAGRLPTAALLVRDDAPPQVADAPAHLLEPLAPGTGVCVSYRLVGGTRGRYTVGPAVVELRDPFGIARRLLRFGGTDEVVVYPPVWRLPVVLPRLGREGTTTQRTAGPLSASGEFANIREYVRGDDLRKVHWRSTAHRGRLMVKQDESPQDLEATVVVDLRRDAHRRAGVTSTLELAVAAAASAACHLVERGYGLRLVDGPLTAPPATVGRETALETLALARPRPEGSLREMWQQLAAGTAGDGLLLAVVPVPAPGELREIVRAGRSFAARVAVLVATPGSGADTEPALAALRTAGWRAAAWVWDQRLADAWLDLALRPAGAPTRVGGRG